MPSIGQPHYPNRFARSFFLATREVIGRHGLNAVLSLSSLDPYLEQLPPDTLDRTFDFADLAALNRGLEDLYGVRGGRGMAQRIGRAWLAQGMNSFGALAGVGDASFQALPQPRRCQIGLIALADVFTRFSDQPSRVEDHGDCYHFVVDASPMAYGRVSDRPVCAALVGLLQEVTHWATGGADYPIQETACQAVGAPSCVFTVARLPYPG